MQFNMVAFRDWLFSQLHDRSLTVADLARRSKLSEAAISHILNNRRRPGMKFFRGIADGLGIPIESVLVAAGETRKNWITSETELELIRKYKELPDDQKEDVIDFVRMKYKRFKAFDR